MIELRWLYPAIQRYQQYDIPFVHFTPKLIYRDVIDRDEEGNVTLAAEWREATIAYDDEVSV